MTYPTRADCAAPPGAPLGHPPPGHPPPLDLFAPLTSDRRQATLDVARTRAAKAKTLRVFAYGSLIWRPCFPVQAQHPFRLEDHAVHACVWTVQARGTPQVPGLALGLVETPSASCTGMVLEVAKNHVPEALEALWEREMLTGIYTPKWLSPKPAEVELLTFCVDPTHPQYAGVIPEPRAAEIVAAARGGLGTNLDYMQNTATGLRTAGFADAQLESLVAAAKLHT
jgi:cation transport protein ChaC